MHFDFFFIVAFQNQLVGFVIGTQFTEYVIFVFLYLKQHKHWILKHSKSCIVEAHIELIIDVIHFRSPGRTDNPQN